ncbi:probable protein phosphatase 2C 55 [Solanum dulcamara]|uniref:probable protein phosphatase 2C 55 n=1 Tax=Solanum dulcamara TaxID=45834 RepID=UPI002486C44C|nr:probable protein phosphatase 2C 55 [Solanum dulcamara]
MLNPSPFFSRVFSSFLLMAIDIVPPKRRRLNDESEFDDDEQQLQFLLCSEKLSPSFDLIDDDIMPIQTFIPEDVDDNKEKPDVSVVGVTGSTIMVAGSFYIPKLNEEKPLGEDASFICAKEQTIGVADGVGGWGKKGVDSGEYSRELMKNAELAIHKQSSSAIDLMKVLNEAFSNTKSKGSSTACILTLSDDTLHAVNVGDSGFVVIREGLIVYKSKIQQSRFNCPFQLGIGRTSDDPSVAEKISVPVIAGDMIVLGTDGLFDNVHDFELETIVKSGVDSWELDVPETLAWRIAQYALDNAKNTELYTPFTRECFKVGIEHYGGKYDDITVIVANIWPL